MKRRCVSLLAVGILLLATLPVRGEEPEAENKVITNSIGMKLVLIPAGEFVMGSPDSEKGRFDNETRHRVRITKPFYLNVYEVTQEQYEDVMGKNPSHFSKSGGGKDRVSGLETKRFPVEQVSWEDAVEFCRRLSEKDGNTYRLPTEAEWEYACRAGTTTPFHFGGILNGAQANCLGEIPYGTSTKGPYLGRTTVVGLYAPNKWGLYNMHGNVLEWCSDWYDKDYYTGSPSEDPKGASSGKYRVLRGGGWSSYSRNCRSAFRYWVTPTNRIHYSGFRVARTP